jgi:KaiC/GvpD/RAD55 family RecA-like ATPase
MSNYADYFAGHIVTGDSSRSAKDMAFAIFLVRKGLTPEEISVILNHAEYNKGKDLKDKYLERTIGKAMEIVNESKASEQIEKIADQPSPESGSHSTNGPTLLRYSEIKDYVYPAVERIPTGIRHIDLYTAGGLGLKELSLIIAEQETGKSTLGCWEGAQAQKAGYNVLHVFYEDDIADLKARYDHHLTHTTSDSDVYFLDGTERPVSVAQIEDGIRKCNPGLVLIDYLARVPGLSGKADDRFSIRDLMMKFGNLARLYNTHVQVFDHITILQDRTDKQGNPLPMSYVMDLSRLSEAKMFKAMVCSIIIGMMKDRCDSQRIWLTGLKMKRKANRMRGVSMQVDWNTGRYVG